MKRLVLVASLMLLCGACGSADTNGYVANGCETLEGGGGLDCNNPMPPVVETCSVVATDNGAVINCPDGTSVEVENGEQGVQGLQGTPGTDGAQGPQGEPGEQGIAGEQGEPGTNGVNGVDGINGTNGTNGTNGINGVDGTDGVNGTNGAPGPQGPQGEPGIDGTSCYVKQAEHGAWIICGDTKAFISDGKDCKCKKDKDDKHDDDECKDK